METFCRYLILPNQQAVPTNSPFEFNKTLPDNKVVVKLYVNENPNFRDIASYNGHNVFNEETLIPYLDSQYPQGW